MKLYIIIVLLLIGVVFYFLFTRQKSASSQVLTQVEIKPSDIQVKTYLKDDFDSVLIGNGLKVCYNYDQKEIQTQQQLLSKIEILSAFDEAIKSLFTVNAHNKNFDNLVSGIIESPEDFGLEENPSPDVIKNAIVKGLNDDSKLKISLVPIDIKEDSGIFPPENGEKVQDFWIWHMSAPNYFPGPIWILVKRDGAIPAYHYGYM